MGRVSVRRLGAAWNRWRPWLRAVVRPLLLLGFGVGGLWLGIKQLTLQPWHHATVVWAGGFIVAAYCANEVRKLVRLQLRFRRWRSMPAGPDRDRLRARLQESKKDLPPWCRLKEPVESPALK